ncbi:MAG TPA: hypothetical protein VKB66_04705 [Candidatus Acidoferrum sp.]|nr:hypothetical protein [Candidatus Acidoferrum sp.]
MALKVLNSTTLPSALSALASKIASPIIAFPPILPPGTVTIVQAPGIIVFRLNGVVRWIIDVRRFAGSPVLTVSGAFPHAVKIQLKSARFPGTELPADFTCLLSPHTVFGTPMELKFVLGGFDAHTSLERWLAGQALAQSAVAFGTDVCPLGATSKLALAGQAEARFFPNWQFQIAGTGPTLATISGLGPDILSHTFSLRLLFPGDPSLSAHPKSKRTHLSLTAGTNTWQLKPAVMDVGIGTLAASDGLFRQIDIEAGESAATDVARVLAASSSRTDALSLKLKGPLTDLNGAPFALALSLPTYAIAFDPTPDHSLGDETTLLSRFGPPVWFSVAGFALLVGDAIGIPGFEAATLKGVVTSVRCAPALLVAAAPLADSTIAARPLSVTSGSTLPFVTAPGAAPGWGVIAGSPGPGQPQLSLPDFAVSLLRPDDLLSLDFLFFNLALEGGGGAPPRLVVKDRNQASYLVVRFNAPQNISERAFFEAFTPPPGYIRPPGFDPPPPPDPLTAPPVDKFAAGPSRLAFQLSAGVTQIDYSTDQLLNWVNFQQSVVPVAQDLPQPIREPQTFETAIEAPWRLFLSPNLTGAWAHSPTPVTFDGKTELWHTRLAVRRKTNGEFIADESLPRKIRAVWSPDYSPGDLPHHQEPPVPFRMPLDANDRDQIVRLSSDFSIPGYHPPTIGADKLFLTALGAWMDVLGDFDPRSVNQGKPAGGLPPALHAGPVQPLLAAGHFRRVRPVDVLAPAVPQFSVEQWRHKAAMARDNYVRVVYAGNLCFPGHRASLVKVTERKLQEAPDGTTTGYLRQSFFLIVREPVKDYGFLAAADQRAFPFRKLRITTLVTPPLDPPTVVNGHYAFFPTVNGELFQFHLVAEDADGQTADLTTPLFFMELGGDASNAKSQWNSSGETTRDMAGQNIAFAQSVKKGDTTLQTSTMTISANVRPGDPPFFPKMDKADVNVPAIQQVSGGTGAMTVEFFPDYVNNDFGPGGVFVQKQGGPLPVGFNGQQSGGVATPNMQVSGLSRRFGTVSGPIGDIGGGNFTPTNFFGDPGAKLFGVIPLASIIQGIFGDNTVPALLTERSLTQITTKLHFEPKVQNFSTPPVNPVVKLTFVNAKPHFTLDVKIITPLNGGTPQTSVTGVLSNFVLELASVIQITFNSITFDAPAGKKLNVFADLPDDPDPLQFEGDLSFLNELRKCIPNNGFVDPPSLDVGPDGVTIGYTLAIPSIGVGVFSIENISLGAHLTLPFLPPNPLRFRFNFSEREHPFLVTVSLLGGGGFFAIELGPDGVEMLEASIEIGANVSIDVVVASGNVHIMAGVYLKLDFATKASQLTGYLRAGGTLDVLGLISASVEFYLGFTYFFGPPCKIAGEATVTIEVHVLFFSASVHASLRREFGDPKISFKDLIDSKEVWTNYCEAFAA